MTGTLAQKMNRSLRWLLGIGALSAIAHQGAYLYKFVFVPGNWFTLSDDPAVWGQYGDFIGGLLNPIFSSLAFGGLVVTIVLQARQMDEAKRYAELEEMQRVQSTIAARIDHLLASELIVKSKGSETMERYLSRTRSAFDVISLVGTYELSSHQNRSNFQWAEEIISDLRDALEAQTMLLRLEFESLSFLLIKYAEHEGSEVVIDFYKYRFTAVLVWLDALGMFAEHHLVQEFFRPTELRKAMAPKDLH